MKIGALVFSGLLLAMPALVTPAMAQSQPPAGVLAPPSRHPAAPAPPPRPPSAAPRTAVQRVAPFSSPELKPGIARAPSELGHAAPGRRPPELHPARNSHAVKPPARPAAKAVPGKPGPVKPGPAKPAAPPPPVGAVPTAPGAAPAASAAPEPASPAEPAKGSVTGLPMPRWVSFRTDEVNLRSGPGMRYPVEWQYHRRLLPVQIEREFEVWRLVEDQDGVKGWVHQATLVSTRSFVVTGAERTLRSSPADTAAPVALLKPGVVGRIRSCAAGKDWCELQVGEYRGWMQRDAFWGTYPGEAVN